MNSDTKEVLDRMMKEKVKIAKMITDEVAQKVKDMSDYDVKEVVGANVMSKNKKSIRFLSLLSLLLGNKSILN